MLRAGQIHRPVEVACHIGGTMSLSCRSGGDHPAAGDPENGSRPDPLCRHRGHQPRAGQNLSALRTAALHGRGRYPAAAVDLCGADDEMPDAGDLPMVFIVTFVLPVVLVLPGRLN